MSNIYEQTGKPSMHGRVDGVADQPVGGHQGARGLLSHVPGTEQHRMHHQGGMAMGGDTPMTGHTGHTGPLGGMGATHTGTTMSGPGGVVPVEGAELVNSGDPIMAKVTDVQPIAPGAHIKTGDIGAIPVDLGGDGLAHAGRGMMGTEGVTRSHDAHHTMGSHTTHETHAGAEGKEPMGHKIKSMIPGTAENKEKKMEQGRI